MLTGQQEPLSPEFCLAAVREDGLMLEYVPDELKTPAICRTAVRGNREAFKFVPKEIQDEIRPPPK